jgi:hypothetical protein
VFHCIYSYYQQTQRGPTGWSETFWNNNSSGEQAVTEAIQLGVLLRNIHSKNALMQGISVRQTSDDPSIKTTRRVSFTAVNETLFQAGSRLPGMYPTTALRIQVRSNDGRSNYVWLRGMPDDIDREGTYTPQVGLIIPMNQFLAELAGPATGWARRQLVAANARAPITAVTGGGVVTCPAHGFGVNDRIRIGRTVSNPNIDKVYRVGEVLTLDTFQIVGIPPTSGPIGITEQSYAQKQFFEGAIILFASPAAVSKRNVGRPTGSPSGRQKTPKN